MPVQVENTTGDLLDVQLPVLTTPAGVTDATTVGAVRTFSESDPGTKTGTARLLSPEAGSDYRLRIQEDTWLDDEKFVYAAQNTAKHIYRNTTMTVVWGSGFLTTNGTSITTINTGVSFATYEMFPVESAVDLYVEFVGTFTAAYPGVTNTTIDFGLFTPTTGATPWAPTDGAYFRMNAAAGLQGVVFVAGGAENPVSFDTDFQWLANQTYRFVIVVTRKDVEFWIDDVLYGTRPRGNTSGGPALAGALPVALRHAIGGTAAGAVIQFRLSSYAVSIGGKKNAPRLEDARGASAIQAYQGQSGGTMGSTSNITNSQAFMSAVLSNTATIVTGLGGRFGITLGASANTDGICTSFQNPANSTTYVGRALKIRGVTISVVVQTALGATALVLNWYAAYGHTALSLATAEAATTKAPRRVPIGIMGLVASAAAGVAAGPISVRFEEPIVVQPGGFFQIVAQQPLAITGTLFCVVSVDAGYV